MTRIVIIFLLLFIGQNSFGQLIDLNIYSKSDTVKLSNQLLIEIEIKNISEGPVYIPHDFFVTSNILPNGLENNVRGFYVHFDIEPVSSWATIHIENTARSNYNEFIKLKPKGTKTFSYDLNRHIKYHHDRLSTDSLKVPLNTKLTISAQFFNNREKPKREDKTATKKTLSNDLNIVLVK